MVYEPFLVGAVGYQRSAAANDHLALAVNDHLARDIFAPVVHPEIHQNRENQLQPERYTVFVIRGRTTAATNHKLPIIMSPPKLAASMNWQRRKHVL